MLNQINKKYKPFYKKLILLRTDVTDNNKVFKFKKKKWETFLEILERKKNIIKDKDQNRIPLYVPKAKPFTNCDYVVTKFASQGNSFKKKFKNDLIAKKTFNYFYGGIVKKYLKKRMNYIYNSKENYKSKLFCLEFFESRLDSVLHRSQFCFSAKNAQQLISHEHVTVNNRIEKNKSYLLRPGDIVKVNKNSFHLIESNLKRVFLRKPSILAHKRELVNVRPLPKIWPIPPKYLIMNYKTLEILFGNIRNYNFSIDFSFKINVHSILINYYRH